MLNKIELGIASIGSAVLGIMLWLSSIQEQIYAHFEIGNGATFFPAAKYFLPFLAIIACVLFWLSTKARKEEAGAGYNDMWRLPPNLTKILTIIIVAMLIFGLIFVPSPKYKSLPGLFLLYNLTPCVVLIFAMIRGNQFIKAMKYDYEEEGLDGSVLRFVEKHPETIYQMKPRYWPEEYLEEHPEIIENLNKKELPAAFLKKHPEYKI